MANKKHQLFISSSMEEFKPERLRIKEALKDIFTTIVYEEDAGAKSQPFKKTYIELLDDCNLYIGIFGLNIGVDTENEFNHARKRGIPCHIYERSLRPEELRNQKLTDFLSGILKGGEKGGLSPARFKDVDHLIKKIKEDLGHWIVSPPSEEIIKKLPLDRKYFCNRIHQSGDFTEAIDEEKAFNFFIVPGDKKQSHLGLVTRFSIEYAGIIKKTITIEDMGSTMRIQRSILKQLFNKFDVRPLPVQFEDFSMNNLVENIMYNNYSRVFVLIRLDEDLLSNQQVLDAMRWFATDYCSSIGLTEGAPKFHFFLNIRYVTKAGSKSKSFQKKLNKFASYLPIKELNDVTSRDIEKWLDNHEFGKSETSKEGIIKKYFEKALYPMEDAQIQIVKLITDYNKNEPELKSIMEKN